MSKLIDTDEVSDRYRSASVDYAARRLLVTNFSGSEQEKDLTVPPNCKGFGRVRHFRRGGSSGWIPNPLPIDPACRALGLLPMDKLRAQAFQYAACNWRCWYCFVPFNLLAADPKRSAWLTAAELIDLYLKEADPPQVIDLTGGQPDLVPEWVPWTMAALKERGLDQRVYLWSDDNLSNDFFWRYLTESDRELIVSYKNYGRVCCFKGFDPESFEFNTVAPGELFERQFMLAKQFADLGIDLYSYVTLTTPQRKNIDYGVKKFLDRLQLISETFPLRTVPLEIAVFSPVKLRLNTARMASINNQRLALDVWRAELEKRFSAAQRSLSITEVKL